ncbi:hypothetical protein HHL16_11460 [Pseudoflavitalea sp. G-6-1-2]|uniref:hypothetical protein n=1 Tax=Pseudoflavitalea sp. G-6-1-2 TaxID=2728841 RepID=UPI00146C029D|nr:hypothetical protein [Pseudoflavitalea sp. G-6-1-2]NML21496.1 hypothetical protein [Pseudoflavitalea sp. G-6-1-2]
MKNCFLIFLVCLLMSAQSFAQPRNRSRDSIGVAGWRTIIKKAPVLTGETSPRIIVPHEQPLCFPMEFDLKISIPGKIAEQAMFINANTGVLGFLPPSSSGLVNMLFPELPDFSFSVMSLKGNAFHYYTRKGKNNTIDRWVSTGNTETHFFQMPAGSFTGAVDLQRKNETAPYCNSTLTATAYRFSTNPDMTWFLFGDRFPEKLHPRKFLGNFGVGYLYTDEGLFIATEFRTGSYTCKVTEIQVTNTCLHTNEFNVMEDKFVEKRTEALNQNRQKLERDAAKIGGDCASEQSDLLTFRREQQTKQEAALRQSKTGNTYQDQNVQRSMLSMMDPLTMVQEGILTTKLSICRAEHSTSSRKAEKINCLNNQLGVLMDLETRMRALDTQYANDPGKAYAEKSKLYMQRRPGGCS